MTETKNDINDSCSSNLVFFIENHFQEDHLEISRQKLTPKFENALFLSAYFQF